jgi:hypothetical protein
MVIHEGSFPLKISLDNAACAIIFTVTNSEERDCVSRIS